MTIDLDKGLAWLNSSSVSAGPPDLGADQITNFQNVTGTSFNDFNRRHIPELRNDTFFGSSGNDSYTGGIGRDGLDYSTLSNFDTTLTTTSTGITLTSSGNPSNADFTIAKGAGGADGTDTVHNHVNNVVGSIGQDTFNISRTPSPSREAPGRYVQYFWRQQCRPLRQPGIPIPGSSAAPGAMCWT